MTEVAVAIAVTAAALALVLLAIVVRQGRAVRELAGHLDETNAALAATREQGQELLAQHRETTAALERALAAADRDEPEPGDDIDGDGHDVTVITDISERLRLEDDLTTARIASV